MKLDLTRFRPRSERAEWQDVTLRGYRLERTVSLEAGSVAAYEASVVSSGDRVRITATSLPEEPRMRRRARRLAKKRLAVRHPKVVRAHEVFDQGGLLYLVTELSDARTLASRIENGPLEPAYAVRVLSDVGEGVGAAERAGVSDILLSPDGILLDAAGGAVLRDLGSATSLIELAQPWAHPQARYFSPELGEGDHLGPRTNVYSLGCILFEALTGSPPFEGSWMELSIAHSRKEVPRVSERRPKLGTAIDPVIDRALAEDPAERFGSARELMVAAAAAVEQVGDAARDTESAAREEAEREAEEKERQARAASEREAAERREAEEKLEAAAQLEAEAEAAAKREAGAEAAAKREAEAAAKREAEAEARAKRDAEAEAEAKREAEAAAKRDAEAEAEAKREAEAEAKQEAKAKATRKAGTKATRGAQAVTRSTATKERGRRGALLLGYVLLGALALGGYLAGSATRGTADVDRAAAGPLSFALPSQWDPRPAERLGQQLRIRGAVAAGPPADKESGMVVGRSQRNDLLPPGIARPGRGSAVPVRLGGVEGYRYRTAGASGDTVGFWVPTTAGAVVVVCYTGRAAARGFMGTCERAASTLDVGGLRAVPLSALVAEARRLSDTVVRLRRRRAAERSALARARTPTGQARAARRLGDAYAEARRSVERMSLRRNSPGRRALIGELRRVERSYGALGRAARRRSRTNFAAARRDVRRSEAALTPLIAGT